MSQYSQYSPSQLVSHSVQYAHGTPPASLVLQQGGAGATLYGPAWSRSRPSDAESISRAQAGYDAALAERDARMEATQRAEDAAAWEASQRANRPAKSAFYNTREGEAYITQAKQELTARNSGAAQQPQGSQRSQQLGVTENRPLAQQPFHSSCVLRCDIATAAPPASAQAKFTPYPLQEYNRWNLAQRAWSGPDTHTRLRSVPYTGPGPKRMDVPRRHDLVKNINKKESIANHNHNLPFLAKHTNNLVSC